MNGGPTLAISFHGGKKGLDNIYNFPANTPVLSTGKSDPSLSHAELRAFTLGVNGDSHLYVVDGYKDSSRILQYEPKGDGAYRKGKVWATEGLNHPFDASWGPDGILCVSNQDPAPDGKIGISAYSAKGKYLGVFAEGFTQLRGIAWVRNGAGNTLWAADEKAGLVPCVYKGSLPASVGKPVKVDDPVHLLYDGSRYLYIGSEANDCVYACDTTKSASQTVALVVPKSLHGVKIDKTSGLAIAQSGGAQYLFVGSRKGMAVNRYQLDSSVHPPTVSKPTVAESGLSDNPEFIGVLGNGVFN